LLEYCRNNPEANGVNGRIYWAKNRPAYDVDAFDAWYQRVVRYLRKHGRRHPADPNGLLFMPEAWSEFDTEA
jgi:hypothetical protein